MEPKDAIGYVIAQLVGGLVGALILVIILKGAAAGYDVSVAGLGQNGWGTGYLGQYGMLSAIIVELVATFLFVLVILGVTQDAGSSGRPAGLIIGIALFGLHLPFIMVTGLSVNPARSLAPAVFVGGTALMQVWLFLVMPVIGGAIAGWTFKQKILSA
jgi:aquaporin Z